MMKPEFAEELKNKALATFLRTEAAELAKASEVSLHVAEAIIAHPAPTAEVLKLEEGRWSGQYVIVRKADELVAVYKFSLRMGPAKATRTESGNVAFVVNSMSTSLKRLKRWPKELLTDAVVVA